MASRVHVAESAFLDASGLFIAAAGGAIALADDGSGYGQSDDRQANDSLGDVMRRMLGIEAGNDQKGESEPRHRPLSQLGNGRTEQETQGETMTKETPTPTKPTPCPEPTEPRGNPAPPAELGGGGGGGIIQLPSFKQPNLPPMQLPDELKPVEPGSPEVLDVGAGAVAAAPVRPSRCR